MPQWKRDLLDYVFFARRKAEADLEAAYNAVPPLSKAELEQAEVDAENWVLMAERDYQIEVEERRDVRNGYRLAYNDTWLT
jgi:type IV secretory pathway TrbF-like protein